MGRLPLSCLQGRGVPHHQGAIDMALTILRFGKSEQAMKLAVGEPLPPSLPAPTQVPTSTIPRPTSGEAMKSLPIRSHLDPTSRQFRIRRLKNLTFSRASRRKTRCETRSSLRQG